MFLLSLEKYFFYLETKEELEIVIVLSYVFTIYNILLKKS